MNIDPKDVVDAARDSDQAPRPRSARLNAVVAVTVAILATFMGICKVKDDNIVQAMQQAQADKLDHWAFYQARNLRQDFAEGMVVQLELARASQAAGQAAAYDQPIAKYRTLAADQAGKKEELRRQALQDQKNYDDLNYRDDQFDLSDAALAIAIAVLAVAALTQLWSLYYVALVPTVLGIAFGTAGLAGWQLHPGLLVKLLS